MPRSAGRFLASLVLLLTVPLPLRAEDVDPRAGAVPLPARSGWRAQLALDRGETGIWTVKSYPVFDAVGSDEVVALDDEGRLTVLIPYSGRWTPLDCIAEGSWLGGLAYGDFDPDIPGAEIYTGGKRGNLWQVVPHAHGTLEARLVGNLEGREIHTIVVDDLEPERPGPEIIFFTWPGGLYRVVRGDGGPSIEKIADVSARIRDAVVLPGSPPRVATVSRGGQLSVLHFERGEPRWREVFRVKSGMGRIARRGDVLYTVCDDGRVYRFAGAKLEPELVYAGPLGMRGVVAGRFHEDPDVESIAVFGYSGRVELLTRGESGWTVETIFEDRDKGHWVCTAEVDGRNGTDEIFCCGYGGRVVMLYRPPGYGRPGVLATEPAGADDPLRIGIVGMRRTEPTITPLVYHGGFTVKALVFETLVRVGDDGVPRPGLAEAWETSADGLRWTFRLRAGARFHDGRPCDAAAVKAHFDRWLGRPEHAWLGMNARVARVEAPDPRQVEFVLREPYPLLRDLAATNPCAVAAGGAGTAVGSGPFRVERHEPGVATVLAHVDDGHRLEIRPLDGGDHIVLSPVAALRAGQVDVVLDGWVPQIPREEARRLGAGEEFRVQASPGSLTVFLELNRNAGPFRERAARLRLAAAIDRAALIRETAAGFAEPRETLFAVAGWPARRVTALPDAAAAPPVRARFLVHDLDPDHVRLALAVARQARGRGIEIEVVAVPRPEYLRRREAGDYDVLLGRTHGLPYDPHMWLVSRFLSADGEQAAPELAAAVRATFPVEGEALAARYAAIQARLEEEAALIPLFAPQRLALGRRDVEGIGLGRNAYAIDLAAARRAR